MTLIGTNGTIGGGQPAALPAADHDFDGVAEKPARGSSISQFARPMQVFPGNLERILKQFGKVRRSWVENEFEPPAFHVTALQRTLLVLDCYGRSGRSRRRKRGPPI
jgi:hypothetical protein